MPGPGGPNVPGGAQAGGALGDDGLQEQVLVAAFPGAPPEVHVASLDMDQGVLTLSEASVVGPGQVCLGRKRTIRIADVASMDSHDGVALLGPNNGILAQLHLESAEDQQTWTAAIRALLNSRGDGEEEDEARMLRARSKQLQNRIGTLEASGRRRDAHMVKMQRRLDGALRMLAAVKDMCSQQRRVLEAQKAAIGELRRESGEEAGNAADGGPGGTAEPESEAVVEAPSPSAGRAAGASEAAAKSDAVAEAEEEVALKTKQMLELLRQADDMQRALHQLQALQGEAEAAAATRPRLAPLAPAAVSTAPACTLGGAGPMSPARRLVAAQPATGKSQEAGDDEEAEDGDPEAVLSRLQELQAEKERYERQVRTSQQEHQALLTRLSEMRALMSDLGIQDDDEEDLEDE